MNQIDILVTFDKNYILPFKVMLCSYMMNNPADNTTFHLLYSSIPQEDLRDLQGYCCRYGAGFNAIQVDKSLFQDAPANKRYPAEMYYRLLSPLILPQSLDKILYLDPDILIINPIAPLWDINLGENVFAAASHTGITEFANDLNRIRLKTNHNYFNSGVMMIDLEKARQLIKADEVFQCVNDYQNELAFPDQDIFNILYGKHTLAVDDVIWNFDARNYSNYLLRSTGKHNLNWIMQNTVILHFCGSRKPWEPSYAYRFGILYKHYMNIAAR